MTVLQYLGAQHRGTWSVLLDEQLADRRARYPRGPPDVLAKTDTLICRFCWIRAGADLLSPAILAEKLGQELRIKNIRPVCDPACADVPRCMDRDRRRASLRGNCCPVLYRIGRNKGVFARERIRYRSPIHLNRYSTPVDRHIAVVVLQFKTKCHARTNYPAVPRK